MCEMGQHGLGGFLMTTIGSRRDFVIGGLATLSAASLAGCDGGGDSSGSVRLPPQPAPAPQGPALVASEADGWEALLGTTFTIQGEGGAVVSTLSAVTRATDDANRPTGLARHRGFYAYFEMSPGATPLGGKVYRLSHAVKGEFELFLSHPSEMFGKGVVHAVLN